MFCDKLEEAVVESVETGFMTKDLAILIHGSKADRSTYLNTGDYMDKIAEILKSKLSS